MRNHSRLQFKRILSDIIFVVHNAHTIYTMENICAKIPYFNSSIVIKVKI